MRLIVSSSSKTSIPQKLDNYKTELLLIKKELLKMSPQSRNALMKSFLELSKAERHPL